VTWGLRCASSRARVTGYESMDCGGVCPPSVLLKEVRDLPPPEARAGAGEVAKKRQVLLPRSRFVSRPATAYIVHSSKRAYGL